jgi:hypothetical protein
MLVYEKKIKHPFKINIAEAVVEAIRTMNEINLPNCFSLYPNLLEQVRKGHSLFYDAENHEYYALVDQS